MVTGCELSGVEVVMRLDGREGGLSGGREGTGGGEGGCEEGKIGWRSRRGKSGGIRACRGSRSQTRRMGREDGGEMRALGGYDDERTRRSQSAMSKREDGRARGSRGGSFKGYRR